jgi:isochorismate synthase
VLPAAEWQAIVAGASAAVRSGDLRKVVLAREIRLRSERAFDTVAALERLVDAYPTCTVFAISQGERTFLGATPERLVRFAGGELRTACLAGSERRGATAEEDRQLGESLLLSAKNREEHAVVVRALRESLARLCDELIMPDAPELLSVSNVHHLYTPVTARPRGGVGLLDAVERLHPTPAVGGDPRPDALAYIRAHEQLDRGWYAAPVGWLGHDGAGEFAVALRSALVAGRQASLFAGCGIMGDSDPAREYAESLLKFRPMLAALGGVAR